MTLGPSLPRVPVDVLVPTCARPAALAVTLTGLLGQCPLPARIVLADQTPGGPSYDTAPVANVARTLELHGVRVERHYRPVRRGIAEQRDFLLSRARAESALLLDDDVLLAPGGLGRLCDALAELGCGFVGMAPQGLSYLADVRPGEQAAFELWDGPVRPERVRKDTEGWERWRLHNAANLTHLAASVAAGPRGWAAYKVAWVAGCALYRTAALRAVGGYAFWRRLPVDQRGEDVVVALRVMERYGGAGLLPSSAVHLELPTSLPRRTADAYTEVLERDDLAACAAS